MACLLAAAGARQPRPWQRPVPPAAAPAAAFPGPPPGRCARPGVEGYASRRGWGDSPKSLVSAATPAWVGSTPQPFIDAGTCPWQPIEGRAGLIGHEPWRMHGLALRGTSGETLRGLERQSHGIDLARDGSDTMRERNNDIGLSTGTPPATGRRAPANPRWQVKAFAPKVYTRGPAPPIGDHGSKRIIS